MNELFRINERQFYRELKQNQTSPSDDSPGSAPDQDELEEFWKNLLSNPRPFNEDCSWYNKQKEELAESLNPQANTIIPREMFKDCASKVNNWRAAGTDCVHGYWIKRFSSLHEPLRHQFQRILDGEVNLPAWMTEGRTVLLAKTTPPVADPRKYRPITCLPVTYKLLTAITSRQQLMMNKMILEDARRHSKNLSVAWIDFQKAYDSISHRWLICMLSMYGFHENIVRFITESMATWRTILHLSVGDHRITTKPISICRGIFQGDTLSPLLFCLAINPISTELEKTGMGYKLRSGLVINHQWYMDDNKLYARSDRQLQSLVNTVERMADDVGLTFGLPKCATLTIHRGRAQTTAEESSRINMIEPLKEGDTYRYLGFAESIGMPHDEIKSTLLTEYKSRVKKVIHASLIGKYTIKAINTYAAPILTYSYGVINWNQDELRGIDIMLRKMLTQRGYHHPKSATERLYMPRAEGGRGLVSMIELHGRIHISLARYINGSTEPRLQALKFHHDNKGIKNKSITAIAEKCLQQLQVTPAEETSVSKITIKNKYMNQRKERLEQKPLHGGFWRRLEKTSSINHCMTFAWLSSPSLSPATEGLLLAVQDQVVRTRNYEWHVMKTRKREDANCRVCNGGLETIDHVIDGHGGYSEDSRTTSNDERQGKG